MNPTSRNQTHEVVDLNMIKIEDPGLYLVDDIDTSEDEAYELSKRATMDYENAIIDWRENIDNFRTIVGLVLVPLFSRLLGRRVAIWAWSRFRVWFHYPSWKLMSN